ncbi:MAG: type III-A CRISPR-associated protein Csm2 [Firmicutes bacterium]|nr:type III-A CRISPR-associated protein Csm2 [Bacillota bacterium]
MSKALDKQSYVDEAEKVILKLDKDKHDKIKLTTNKIRNILTLINELYAMVNRSDKKMDEDLKSRIQYTRMRIVYEAGRDENVKELCIKSQLLDHLKNIGDDTEDLLLVCHYMEALVAYHKYYTTEK